MSEESKTHEMSKQSSEVNKVTAVEKSEKTKDPRKVELGKRLAKISKEAKERKAKHREAYRKQSEAELDSNDQSLSEEINDYVDFIPFRYLVGGVTIVAALGGLYYAYKNDVRLAIHNRVSEQSEKVKTINKNDSEPKYEITKCKPSHLAMDTLSCIENL